MQPAHDRRRKELHRLRSVRGRLRARKVQRVPLRARLRRPQPRPRALHRL